MPRQHNSDTYYRAFKSAWSDKFRPFDSAELLTKFVGNMYSIPANDADDDEDNEEGHNENFTYTGLAAVEQVEAWCKSAKPGDVLLLRRSEILIIACSKKSDVAQLEVEQTPKAKIVHHRIA